MKQAVICVLGFAALALCAVTALAQAPADPLAPARAAITANKLADAESIVREFLAQHADSADGHFLLGYVLFREQRAKESLAEFTAGAKYRRPDASDLKIVASDYVMLKGFAEADKWFSEVVAEKPFDVDAWYLLGRTQYNEEKYQEAIKSFERALALRPKYVEAENNLGLSHLALDDNGKAEDAFKQAIAWEGDAPRDAQPFLNLGALQSDKGDMDAALPNLKKAESLAGDNPRLHEELAKVYQAKQDLPQARTELEIAVRLAPESSGLHYKLGQLYRRMNLKELSDEQFAICSKLNSAHSSTPTPNPPR